jgi:PKD repeat protein
MEEFFQKKLVFLITALVLIVVFVGLISAGFQLGSGGEGNYSIEKVYGPEFNLTGWVNVSFDEEFLNSTLSDNFGNSITLEEILEINPSYIKTCSTEGCGEDYSLSNGETTKIVDLTPGSSELVGFELAGDIVSINSIVFDVESDGAENSCTSPLKVDVLDDGIIESRSEVLTNDLCSSDEKDYGCFDIANPGNVEEFRLISGSTYCQRINLSESPGFRIGAWVKELTASSELTMTLYKDDGLEVANCLLPTITSEQEYGCDVDYATSGGDHFVCISSGIGNGDYNIRGEANPVNKCGFFNEPIRTETSSYQMFAKSKKFGTPGTQNIIDDLGEGIILSAIVEDYLTNRYGTSGGLIQCSQGCVVPLNLISGLDQQITLNNLQIDYEKQSGIVTNDKFYDVAKVPAKVSSSFQKLHLNSAGFTLPSEFGNHSFSLSLNGNLIFSEDIEIKNAPVISIIKPTETAVAFPTEFEAKVFSSSNITKYEWDFGDNVSTTTLTEKVTHTYSSVGVYDLQITVTDSRDISSSKNFSINVSSARDLIEDSLASLNLKVEKIKDDISTLDLFHRQGIESVLGLDSIEAKLKAFEKAFNSSTSEENYSAIIINLIKIQLPQGIIKTVSAPSVSFFDTLENVDMDILKEIDGGSYGSKESAYRNSVLAWQAQNINIKIDFNEFSDEETTNSIVKIFEIEISEKKNINHDYYLVIPNLKNIGFEKNLQIQEDGYSYVVLNGDSRVSFYTTEDVDFINLPIFVAPPISRLSVVEDLIIGDERKERSNLIVILVIILVAVLALVVYFIMQEWYKRKYESYLFKNKNDLYNMVNYVNSAKKKGLKKEEIKKNLKKSGWNSERVKFVMKKYAGKRTGMLEIPIGKIIKKVDKNSNNKTTT